MKIVSNGKTLEVPSCASQDIYSTEEQVVGRWIDGKPIYRRVLSGTIPPTAYNSVDPVVIPGMDTIEDIDTVVNISFSLHRGIYVLSFTQESLAVLKWDKSVNTVRIQLTSDYNVGARLNVIIEYTKTTDQATDEIFETETQLSYKVAPQSTASTSFDTSHIVYKPAPQSEVSVSFDSVLNNKTS